MRSDEAVMAASRAPPAKHTVTQVPQPTTSTFCASVTSVLISARGFCSAMIMFDLQSRRNMIANLPIRS